MTKSEASMLTILIVDSSSVHQQEVCTFLRKSHPEASIISADDCHSAEALLSTESIDIVVIDFQDCSEQEKQTFFVTVKTVDYEPSIVVVENTTSEENTFRLYEAGCYRVIKRSPMWLHELDSTMLALIRTRQIANENLLLRSKLTESNMLLEEKNRRLNHFTMTLAHDIRAPLAALAMRLEYILEGYEKEFPEKYKKLMSSGLSSTERLISLVQSLYEHATLGAEATKMERCCLKSIIQNVVSDLALYERDNFEMVVDALPAIWGNNALLYQLLMNLIGNAVKYNDKVEQKIAIRSLGIKQRPLGQFLEIELQDNGPGIRANIREEVFSLFQRGKSDSTTRDGAGIGLATAKHIVELHGGSIEIVDSMDPALGATFHIALPLQSIPASI